MSVGGKFDRDPEALAWAAGHVRKMINQARKFEVETRDPAHRARWRLVAYMAERKLIGGEGCVIAAFDPRKPKLLAALDESE